MTVIRQLGQRIDSNQIKPKQVTRTAEKLVAKTYSSNQQFGQTPHERPRRNIDRRCDRDRRQQQRPVLLDLRSPHARRTTGRRSNDAGSAITGIDVYA